MLFPSLGASSEVPWQQSWPPLLQLVGPRSQSDAGRVCRMMLAQDDAGHVHGVMLAVFTGQHWQHLQGSTGSICRAMLAVLRG